MNKYKKLHNYSILTNLKSNISDNHLVQSQQIEKISKTVIFNNYLPKSNIEKKSRLNINSNFITKPQFVKQQRKISKLMTSKTRYCDGENKTIFFANLFKLKIAKLSTSITYLQKERYLRKLAQTLEQNTFRAVAFQFDVEFVKQICEFISSQHITKIVLDKNPLGDEGIFKLSGYLAKMPVQQLSLVSVGITNKSAKYLFKSLTGNSCLKILNISSIDGILKNKVTVEGAGYLKMLLTSESCGLDTIYLDNINLGTEGTKSSFDIINFPPLKCLTLSKNEIGSKSMHLFSEKISALPLMHLDLSKNNIMDVGLKSISHILGSSYGKNSASINLIHLNLSSNNITSHGLQIFCNQMSQNQTLQVLFFDQNPLGEGSRFFNIKYFLTKNWGLKKLSLANISPSQKDLKYICEALESNRSLQSLNISKNQISGQVFSSILSMLIKNKSVRQICMNNCMLSDVQIIGNQPLLNSAHFTTIEQIELENNFINKKGCDFFKRMLCLNPNIWKLNLKKNCAGENIISQITKILNNNKSKLPSQFELNHYKSVSNLYEEKRRALKTEVEIMKNYEETLKSALLADEISHQEVNKQKIAKQIEQERMMIKQLLGQRLQPIEDSEEEEDQMFFTQFCS